MSSAPWEKGLNTGRSRQTLSKLKDEIDAMFPVLKKADCKRTKKKSATRASDSVNGRNCGTLVAAVIDPLAPWSLVVGGSVKIWL